MFPLWKWLHLWQVWMCMEWIRQVIHPYVYHCLHLAKELPYDGEQSESKALHVVIFHINLHLRTSVFTVDKRCLDTGAVVSLTSLDMMYTLLILAHALREKNFQILSVFTQITSRLQKLKRMLPTCTAPPTHSGSLCDPVFMRELPQKSSSFTGNSEWGKAVTGTHWFSTNCCHLPTDINDGFFW